MPPPALYPPRLSAELSGTLRTFSYWVANGSVGLPVLDGIAYRDLMLDEPSLMEMAFAIFANVLELDANGVPINAKWAEHRAAQYIRRYCDSTYEIVPPLTDEEMTLHGPPPVTDRTPWPT
jgi:hypothetical protein